MVGHDDEFVQKKAALRAIPRKYVDEEASHPLGSENGSSSVGHGCDEKRTDPLRGVLRPGLKPVILNHTYAALKGRSSTPRPALPP